LYPNERRPLRLFPPLHFEYADRVFEAAQFVVAEVGEEEAFAGAELAHGHRGEDLAAVRLRGDAGGEDDGGAEEVAASVWAGVFDRLAGVEADADVEGLVRVVR
jgi:hypothetical protein